MIRLGTLILAAFLLLPRLGEAQGVLKFGTQPVPIPYVTGPVDPGTQQANINSLIQELNAVLSPVLPGFATQQGGNTGITVGPPAGTSGNVGVTLNPAGSGNIQLFTQADTGLLQIAEQSAWFPAQGLTQCPGVPAGKNPTIPAVPASTNALLGPGGLVSGFYSTTDWLGRPHYLVTC